MVGDVTCMESNVVD